MNRKLIALIGILVISGVIAGGVAYWVLKPNVDVMARYEEAKALVEQGNYQAARLKLQEAARHGGNKIAGIMAMRADVELEVPDPNYGDVLQWYRQAKDIDLKNLEYRRKLIKVYERVRYWNEMLTEAEELSALAPEDTEALDMAARASIILYQTSSAVDTKKAYLERSIAARRRLLELEPGELDHYKALMPLLLHQREVDEAEKVLQAAMEHVENKAQVYLLQHEFYRYRSGLEADQADRDRYIKQAEESLAAAEAAVADDDAGGLVRLAFLYAQQGNVAKAGEYADRSIKADARDAAPYIVRSELYRRENDVEKAIEVLRQGLAAVEVENAGDKELETRSQLISEIVSLLLASDPKNEAIDKYLAELEAAKAPHLNLLKGRQALTQNRFEDARRLLEAGTQSAQSSVQLAQTLYFLGQAYENLGLTGRAEKAYRDALANNDKMDAVRRNLAGLLVTQLNRYDEGENLARSLVAANGKDRTSRLILAESLRGQGKLTEAVREYNAARSLDPSQSDAYIMLANILSGLQQPEQAEKVLQEGLKQVPGGQRFSLYFTLLGHYQRLEDSAGSERVIAQAQADGELSDAQKAQLQISGAASVEERLARAEAELKKDPGDAARMVVVAALLSQNGKAEESVDLMRRAFDRAVETDNMQLAERAWESVWNAYLGSPDRFEEARAWLEKAPATFAESRRELYLAQMEMVLALRPPADQEKSVSERLAEQVGHIEKAIELLSEVEKKDASNVSALTGLGRSYLLKGGLVPEERQDLLKRSLSYYEKVVELRPQNIEARQGMVDVLINLGQPERALSTLGEILRFRPNDPATLERRAMVQQSMALYQNALDTRREIERVAPDYWPNQLGIAQLATILGLGDQVEPAMAKAFAASPTQPEVVIPYAQLLFGKGDEANRAKADKMMADLVASDRFDPLSARIVRCRYNAQTGRAEAAVAEAEELMSEYPESFEPVLFLSTFYNNTRQIEKSREVVGEFVKRHPDHNGAKMHLAEVLSFEGGDIKRSESLAREVLKAAPGDVRAQTMLARVLMQQAVGAADDPAALKLLDSARKEVEKVLAASPDYGMGRMTMADIYLNRGYRSKDASTKDESRQKAIEQLRQISQTDQVYSQALFRLAELVAVENRDDATGILLTLLRVEPANLIGRLRLAALQSPRGAISTLRDGLRYSPDNPVLTIAMIQRYIELQELGTAQSAAQRLVEKYSQLPDAWQIYCEVMRRSDKAAEATQALREQIRSDEERRDTYLVVLSQHLSLTGEFAEARKINEELLEKYPEASRLYLMQSDVLVNESVGEGRRPSKEALEASRDLLLKGVEQTKSSPDILERLVVTHNMLGDWESAVRASDQILERLPNHAQTMFKKSEALINLKRYDEALHWARLGLALKRDAAAHNNVAWILATEKNNLVAARQEILKALALSPENASFRDTSGWIFYLQGDYHRAIAELTRSLDISELPLTHYHIGQAQQLRMKQSRRQEDQEDARSRAKAHFERYIELSPSGEHVEEVRKMLQGLQ